MNLARIVREIEEARKRLASVDLGDRKRLLEISRELDQLVLEYYRQAFLLGQERR